MPEPSPLRIAVFGIGEAGSLIAADLAMAGAEVRTYDPAPVPTPPGVARCVTPAMAVRSADVVLAITAAADAPTALEQSLDDLPSTALYADLSTSSPAAERRLAATAGSRGLDFADVALMSTVLGNGLRTPQLAAGGGADRYAHTVGGLGAPVCVIGPEPGAATTRKLLRSIVTKGIAALVVESLRAAQAAGPGDWLWPHLVAEVEGWDRSTLTRLVEGTGPHARRRHEEMEAVAGLLDELGLDAVMTRAVIASLAETLESGDLPDLSDVPAAPAD